MSNQYTTPWTKDEDDLLIKNYGRKTYKDLSKILRNRSTAAVKKRCGILQIRDKKNIWSEEELDIPVSYTHLRAHET